VDGPGAWLRTMDRASHFGTPRILGSRGPAVQAQALFAANGVWAKRRECDALSAQTIVSVYALDQLDVDA
jgi:hypothetical protein